MATADWTGSTGAGRAMGAAEWISLVFSTIALVGQIGSSIARRGRLEVRAKVVGSGSAWNDFHNKFFVAVEVRSLGRSNGIETVDFEWREDPGQWSMIPADPVMPGLPVEARTVADVLDVFKVKRVLPELESASWAFRISTGEGHDGVDRPRQLRAVVTLGGRKFRRKFRSDYFLLLPDGFGEREAGEGAVGVL